MKTNTEPLESMIKEIVGQALEETVEYHMEFLQDNVNKAVNLAIANALSGMMKGLVESHSEVDSPQPRHLLRKGTISARLQKHDISDSDIEEDVEIPDFDVISGQSDRELHLVLPAVYEILKSHGTPLHLSELFAEVLSKYKMYVVRSAEIMTRLKNDPTNDIISSGRGLFTIKGQG